MNLYVNDEVGDLELDRLRFIKHLHSAPFIIERDNFNFVSDINVCDSVAILCDHTIYQYQVNKILEYPNIKYVFHLDIFHVHENTSIIPHLSRMKLLLMEGGKTLLHIHTNSNTKEDIFYDFLWNRQKCAFTNFEGYGLKNTEFFGQCSNRMFELSEIKKVGELKKFLSPNRTYIDNPNDRIYKRICLRYILELEDGYTNDPDRGISLDSQEEPDNQNFVKFEAFNPIHNRYYNSSFLSIYVETLTYLIPDKNKQVKSVTEKTWNPLLKGHFILPFGYCGLVKDIKNYGFLMADWIDYGYDTIEDDRDRFDHFISSVKKVLELSVEDLNILFERDLWMLEHNRGLFFDKPLDNIYNKIIKKI